ncbi:MAG TPA: dipeptide ABC transporter ATP-binding protein [Arsenicitalea sp.]|nr:dipeptide ABC transporter ATP-binding protein [Arsenicitalea sp.]
MTDAARQQTPIIVAKGLTRSFSSSAGLQFLREKQQVRAVDDVSFELMAGETLAVVGESGCGKSTLGRLLLKLIEPSAGSITYDGIDYTSLSRGAMHDMRRHIQMVFQDPYGSLSPRRTAGQIIAEPMEAFGLYRTAAERREKVAELLRVVGLLPDHANRYPGQFSGGQRQRIGIARAIAVEPRVIVADEPVSALDVSVQAQVINLFQDLQAKLGIAYLFIAHDLAVVRHIADRVAVMYLGRIVEIGPKRPVYSAPQHPYTHALLSAVPKPDPRSRTSRIVLEGDVPSPSRLPSGCAFHTRCPIARERCKHERPLLREVAPSQFAACHFATPSPLAGLVNDASLRGGAHVG